MTHIELMNELVKRMDHSVLEQELSSVKESCGLDIYQVAMDFTWNGDYATISLLFCPKGTSMIFKETLWANADAPRSDLLISDAQWTFHVSEYNDLDDLPDFSVKFGEGTPEYEFATTLLKSVTL